MKKTEKNVFYIKKVSEALSILRKLPNDSIQLIICDPPYNIDIEEWDSYEDYIGWAQEWIVEAYRVLKEQGNLVLFGGIQFENPKRGDLLELIYYIRNNTEFKLVNMIIWYYKNGISAKRFFSNRHEEIAWFTKSKKYIFNLDSVKLKYDEQTLEMYKKDKRLKQENLEKGKNPTNVWEIARLNANSKERVGHPTQKPKAVIERIVKAMSNEGDLVLDFFAGSCITARVCIEHKRHCIVSDIDVEINNYLEKQLRGIERNNCEEVFSIQELLTKLSQ